MIAVARPDLAPDVALAVDRSFKNSLAETLTETEKAFNQGFIAMSGSYRYGHPDGLLRRYPHHHGGRRQYHGHDHPGAHRRLRDYENPGFRRHGSIAVMIFGESLVIALTGCFAGMILTFPAAKAFGQTLSTYFPIFIVSAQTLWLDLLAALLIAFFAAIIPARRAIRVGIAEGLRRIG